jgi:hypothetical protein
MRPESERRAMEWAKKDRPNATETLPVKAAEYARAILAERSAGNSKKILTPDFELNPRKWVAWGPTR